MTKLAVVHPKAIAAAAVCQATDDVRYYLNGVAIQPDPDGGIHVVATDGHRMAVITDRGGECQSNIIVKFDPAAITKMKHKKAEAVTIQVIDDDTVIAVVTGANLKHVSAVEIIDAKYPAWQNVMPKDLPKSSYPAVPANAEFAAGFAQMAKILDIPNNTLALVNGVTPETPMCAVFAPSRYSSGEFPLHAQGVVMPVLGAAIQWHAPKSENAGIDYDPDTRSGKTPYEDFEE